MKMKKRLSLRLISLLLCALFVATGVFTSCTDKEADPAGGEAEMGQENVEDIQNDETGDEKADEEKEENEEIPENTGVVYVNAASGKDTNHGLSAEKPFATIEAAFALLNETDTEEKKVVVSGALELDVLPKNEKSIKIVGDGSEGTQIVCSANGITLSGPVEFDDINLRITTANKFINTEGNALVLGAGVTHDSDENVSDALSFHVGTCGKHGGHESFTFATDVHTVFVGSYYNDDFKNTAGADIVMDGGSCYRIVFGADGWTGSHMGVIFTDDVNFTYNGGELNLIARHTDKKAPSFKGALQLVANNGMVFPEIPKMYAQEGVFILSCEAVEGCYLEPVDTGVFKVHGTKTAVAKSDEGEYVSAGGYLVAAPGTYSVTFVDEVYYNTDGETVEFTGDFAISPKYLYHKNIEGKVFLGWTYADGSSLDGAEEFSAGDKLSAVYADYKPEDFVMLDPVASHDNGKFGIRFETVSADTMKDFGIIESGIVVVDKEKLSDATLTYNLSYAKKYPGASSVLYDDINGENAEKQYLAKGYVVYNDLFGEQKVIYTDEFLAVFQTLAQSRAVSDDTPADEKAVFVDYIEKAKEARKQSYLTDEKIDVVGTSADPKTWIYQLKTSGLMIREVEIDTGSEKEPVEIVQVSDLHFNYLNERDFEEANPSILATYAGRKWLANASSVPNAVRSLEYASTADQIVVTGDVLDYMSWGAFELMWEHIFTPYPEAIVTLGNHEATRRCQDKPATPDPTTLESRMEILQENWAHDIYYYSKVLDERVMLIQMDDGAASKFWDVQIEPLKKDLELAREKGYTVLLFFHIPLCTGNPEDTEVYAIRGNDGNVYDFYNNYIGKAGTDGASKQVYDIITSNGDIIKGIFTGHKHGDYYTEILAKTASGEDTVIPQYVLTGTPYDKGHALRITVK